MRQYLSLGRRPNFTAQHWPCLVPELRLVPSKIAASGIENALLAMTESVGFSEKRDSFQIEMFEKRCRATPRKKAAYNKKRPFSKQNRPNFVSLRGAQRRGNLKAKGMASRSEARERNTTESPNFKSSRSDTTAALLRKRYLTRAQARISHASVSFTRPTAEFHCTAIFTCPKAELHCAALAVPRSGMPVRSVKDCRVGH